MNFQLLRCSIALAADPEQVVVRHRGRPIVFPELIVLQFLHGEEAIQDIHVVCEWDATQAEVLERLKLTYGDKAVAEVFPGARPRLPMADGSLPICVEPIHVPGPTRPDSPDPILKPLDVFTMPASMPRVVSTYKDEPPPPDVSIDQIAGHDADDLGDDPLGLVDVVTAVTAAPKPEMPDAASFRARDNIRGEGTSAPRTADHLPDVAGGAMRRESEGNLTARTTRAARLNLTGG
jgi:hypothetical protein